MGHDHHHHHEMGPALKWSLAATVLFVVVEGVAGVQAHSLALFSDAGHNLTDALAIGLALLGVWFQSRPANESKTFGYQRAGVLAAFVNALTLLALSAFLFYESYERLKAPQAVNETTMIVVATLGLIVNVGIMWALHRGQKEDINIRAAYIHMLGDALGSVGIIIGAFAIRSTGWMWIDPVLSIGIGLLIVWSAWDIIRESLDVLLEGLPRGIRFADVSAKLKEVEGVVDVHDLHIWSLGAHAHALSCHVQIADMPPSASESILTKLNQVLEHGFHIHHTTIQFEHINCAAVCRLAHK
jgi:cobalt-zinc-cadmium efflux system protein